MLVLVRHGYAGVKKDWRPRDDRDRPLTPLGLEQAGGVARNLKAWTPTRLLSSSYVRCVQTLEPLAEQSALRIEIVPFLEPATGGAQVAKQVAAHARGASGLVVMSTHGEVIAQLLRHWKRSRTVHLPLRRKDIVKSATEKGGMWVVLDEDPHRRAEYLPPLAVAVPLTADEG